MVASCCGVGRAAGGRFAWRLCVDRFRRGVGRDRVRTPIERHRTHRWLAPRDPLLDRRRGNDRCRFAGYRPRGSRRAAVLGARRPARFCMARTDRGGHAVGRVARCPGPDRADADLGHRGPGRARRAMERISWLVDCGMLVRRCDRSGGRRYRLVTCALGRLDPSAGLEAVGRRFGSVRRVGAAGSGDARVSMIGQGRLRLPCSQASSR